MDFVFFPYFGPAEQRRVGHDARAAPDLDRPVDDDVGADLAFRMDLGARIDDRRGMDHPAAPRLWRVVVIVVLRLVFGEDRLSRNFISAVGPDAEMDRPARIGANQPKGIS